MIHREQQFFKSLLVFCDLSIMVLAWLLAYYLRFFVGPFPVYKGIPAFDLYLSMVFPLLLLWWVVFSQLSLYRVRGFYTSIEELWDVGKATTISLGMLIVLTFFLRQYESSRLVFVYFWFLAILFGWLGRRGLRVLSHLLYRKGIGVRSLLVIGTGEVARRVLRSLGRYPTTAVRVVGCLSAKPQAVGEMLYSAPILGGYQDLSNILKKGKVDQVIVALSSEEQPKLLSILDDLGDGVIDVKVVPDLYQYMTVCGSVEMFEGMPLITLQESPLYGWNQIFKRLFDFFFSLGVLMVTAPLFMVIMLAIQFTSKGPVFYRQKRMGLDGKIFNILKFRTMRVDAEQGLGPVWATQEDSRRTSVGKILRRFSLDEFPQFINVLKGEMSVVGPRPERPELIEKFKKKVPRYMLRHKVKAGVTGWAQVSGWRGNTSLERRIEYDLYYLENWSLWFDLKIIFRTLPAALFSRSAY